MNAAVVISIISLAVSATAFYVTITVLAALAHDQEEQRKAIEKTAGKVRLLFDERDARRLNRTVEGK